MAGRGSNDITSAVTRMLERIIRDKPTVKKLYCGLIHVLHMPAAIHEFILKHPQFRELNIGL